MFTKLKNEGLVFLHAVQFLTRVPVHLETGFSPARLRAAIQYYPLVGACIGGLCALILWGAALWLPMSVSVLLSMACGMLLTGAFHEDGLADTFDGIGGGVDRARALEIMKDSRVGTYGALALIVAIGLKFSLLVELGVAMACVALPVLHGLSRLSSVIVIATSRYVRDHGTGKPVADGIKPVELLVACMTGLLLLLCLWWFAGGLAMVSTLVAIVFGHAFIRLFFEKKLGGYTGDTLGAVQQVSEIAGLIGLLAVTWP